MAIGSMSSIMNSFKTKDRIAGIKEILPNTYDVFVSKRNYTVSTSQDQLGKRESVKFIDINHPGFQSWIERTKNLLANNLEPVGFKHNIMFQIQEMVKEVIRDVNDQDLENRLIDFSSRKHPKAPTEYPLCVPYLGNVSQYVFEQIREELFSNLTTRDMLNTSHIDLEDLAYEHDSIAA